MNCATETVAEFAGKLKQIKSENLRKRGSHETQKRKTGKVLKEKP
jgi:hypothetical protein